MFWVFSIFLCVFFRTEVGLSLDYEIHYIQQNVDHFGYANQDTFLERYFLNLKYYNPKNGSIFFYCGNEGSIEMFSNNTGIMWEHAKDFNAALVFAEHRYYGESLPYGKLSYQSNKYRGYLTAEQALSDFATLIYYLKHSLAAGENVPIIAFGGSYGGMLSAWLRIKYPHLVSGAIASSAPILAFDNSYQCEKYSEIIFESFKMCGESCPNLIKRSWRVIRKIGSSERGATWLAKQFKLCESLQPTNVSVLVDAIVGVWNYLAMTNYPYPTHFLQPLPAYPIKEVCRYLNDTNITDYELITSLHNAVSVYTNYTGNNPCFELQNVGGKDLGEKGWDYQSCTEMVMPVCSNGITDMFEPQIWNFSSFALNCMTNWKVKPLPNKVFITYGGKNIEAASEIVFTNGKLDPWYAGGVLQSISKSLIAIQIDNAAHHLDLRFSNPADPPSVKDARKIILKYIYNWVYNQ